MILPLKLSVLHAIKEKVREFLDELTDTSISLSVIPKGRILTGLHCTSAQQGTT